MDNRLDERVCIVTGAGSGYAVCLCNRDGGAGRVVGCLSWVAKSARCPVESVAAI